MNLDPDSIRRLEGHAEVLQALLSGRTRSPVVRHMLLFDAARRAQNRRQEAGVVLEVDSDDKVAQLVEELVKSTCVARPPYADLITTVAQLTFEKKGLIEMVLLALVSLPGLSTVVSRIGGSQGQGEKAVAAAMHPRSGDARRVRLPLGPRCVPTDDCCACVCSIDTYFIARQGVC
jgi:hypothetical protein